MANGNGLQFTLALAGHDELELAVVDFMLEEALSAPFILDVDFASRNPDLDPADFLDRSMTLTVWQDREALRRVHGIVSEFARGNSGHRHTFYRVVIQPPLWRLSLRHNSRIFQHTSPLAIIETLCRERGITDITFAVTRELEEREFLVQYRESDLTFIQRLAAEEGLCYYHEFEDHPGGAHRLVVTDTPHVLAHLGTRRYHSRAGGTPPQRHLRRLQQVSRVRPSAVTLQDRSFKTPAYRQLHEHQASGLDAHAQRTDYEHYDAPGRYKRDASGQPFTRIRLEHLRHDALTAEAQSDLPELAPGHRFTLTGHDAERLNRDWQVVEAVHRGSQPQALEEDAVGSDGMTTYHNELVLTPGDSAWRPAPNPKPRVDGPQVATVVGPEGEEIHCDEYGRVKVQLPWDRYADANERASAWIRVSQGWAGGGYGSIAIPRIGHEVIVSFLEGDPDQPLITGRTYHAVNTPPYALPEHKTRTVLRTQSHKSDGFNELRFDDANGAEQIWLHAQKDLELLTHNDRTEEIGRDSHLTVQRDRISEIDGDDHLTSHGNRHTQIDGDDHLIVGATRHQRYGRSHLIEAGQEIHYRAGSKTVIDAGAEITLSAGGSFLKLDPSGITLVGPSVRINSGGRPGAGSGQAAESPLLPGRAVAEAHEDVTLKPSAALLKQDYVLHEAALGGEGVCEVCTAKGDA